MRDNLVNHRFKESSDENLMVDIPNGIKKDFGIDLTLHRPI